MKAKSKQRDATADACPFRAGDYAKIWTILFRHRAQGITRSRLIIQTAKITGKSLKLAGYSVAVIVSVGETTPGHKSVRTAGNAFYVEREGDRLYLRLRNAPRTPTE